MPRQIDPYRTPPAKLTSPPYPEIVIERMTVAISIVSAEIYGWLPLAMTCSISAVSGELREILKSYDVPAEKIELAASIVSGEMRETLKSYDVPAESIGLSVEIQSGELKVILINHEDCGAYGAAGNYERHKTDLEEAERKIEALFPHLDVETYYLHLDGTFEKMSKTN